MEYRELILSALEAREKAYCPYSNFKVGAAVLFEDGKIYDGSNIENASFGGTNCAERTAIFKGVHEGNREIQAIAVVGDIKHILIRVEYADRSLLNLLKMKRYQ